MDEFIAVSPLSGSVSFDTLMHSPVSSLGPTEFTERSGSYLNSLINAGAENIKLSPSISCEEKYNPASETIVPPVSFVSQDPNAGMVFPLSSLGSIPYNSETTNCEKCGALISNNEDAIMSHLQRCSHADDQLSGTTTKKIDKSFVDIKPNTSAISVTYNGDEQVVQVNWEKYMRTLQVKSAPDYSFPTKSYTFEVPGLDPGMKLEAIDKNNPQSFCVATIVEVVGQRVKIRYDGYGHDSSNDFWCNFQAEELYPIGWCAQNSFPLQPPTGINCTLEEWRKFLTQTLTGALAAPKQLFPSEHYQPKVHAFQVGMKMEVIHPTNPYVFCAATVVKSLGPYYFLVATDKTNKIPSVTMCCHSETSTIFPAGWSYKNGIEFTVPSGYTRKTFSWEKYVASSRAVYAPQHLFKKSKPHKFRAGQKLEAVDIEEPCIIRVATITNVMGRVLQLFFDGQTRFQFVECDSPDIHGSGWCKRTGHPLFTPYGKAPFRTITKYEGSESCQKPLKLISFADVMGRNPTLPNVANPSNPVTPSNQTAPSNQAAPNLATMLNQATLDVTTPSNLTVASSHATPSNLETSNIGTSSFKTSFNTEASANLITASNFQVKSPNLATPSNFASTPNVATRYVATSNVTATIPGITTSTSVSGQPCVTDAGLSGPENPGASSTLIEADENGEDKTEKCPTLSPSDDDEDLSDEDGSCTGPERFYHNKNQIFFNKTCCCGPLLNLEEIKRLPDATEPGKVSTVIRIGLEMVAKCANEPERVLEMMQEGSGVRLMVKHNGKILKKAITRVDSRPKLERYLKRFCRRLVCCEYFLSLTPVGYPCPDDCKADQYGNLQGPKGMKAKRARDYFETKHLGYEKKKRGRKTKAVANEAAAQRAAAGIVTSVFHKGNHVPLPNLNLPVNAIADHLRNTATKILHQVQASQGLSSERAILHTKAVASTTIVTQITASPITPTTPHHATPHLMNPHHTTPNSATPSNTANQPTVVVPSALTNHPVAPGAAVPTYGKPRLLPSPYGPPPLPVTTTTTVTSGVTTSNGRNGSPRVGRTPNQPPPKKIIRPIIPAGPLPDGTVPLVEIPIKIPPANKLPLPSRSITIPVTTITASSDAVTSPLVSSAKPVFRLAPPKFVAVPQSSNGIATTTFSGRLVALPRSLATGASFTRPNPPNSSNQTTTLVTANRRPIPASISLTRSGPPPLIPARAISGTPANPKATAQSVQLIRPRLVERKVVSAAPNVCVTERGTIVAAQVNKTSGTSSGACVVNPVVGHSPDANAMMKKMFSVVRGSENCIPISIAPAKVVASVNHTVPTQFAHIYPNVNTSVHDQKTNNSHQNTKVAHQNTNVCDQNTNVSHQNTKKIQQNTNVSQHNTNKSRHSLNVTHQNTKTSFNNANKSSENTSTNKTNQNTNRPYQNMFNPYQKTNKFDSNTNGTNSSTIKFNKNANNYSQKSGTVKRYSLNVGGGMGAVTTAVRSGMLARENYKSPEGSRDTKHNITKEGGYSIKINENSVETKTGTAGIHSAVTKISDLTANQFESIPKVSETSPNQSVTTPNSSNVSPAGSEEYPMASESQPNNIVQTNEPEHDVDKVGMNKQRSAWLNRRRKKKKVRFTYVKGKNKKKKEGENEVETLEQISYGFGASDGFVQEYDENEGEIQEQKGGRAVKREHDEDVDDKNDPTYAPPHPKRFSDFTHSEMESKYSVHMSRQMAAHVSTVASTVGVTSSCVTSPKAELMKGVLHAVQSSQHPSVKLRSPSEKQLHSLNGFSSPPRRSRFHSTDSHTSRKHRAVINGKPGTKSSIPRQKISVSTNTSLPGCPADKCLYHPENPRLWSIEQVGEYVQATDCKNYATYLMDQEIDGESLLMLSRTTLMQFTTMKLGPTLKLSNYIAQLRARVGMSKHT